MRVDDESRVLRCVVRISRLSVPRSCERNRLCENAPFAKRSSGTLGDWGSPPGNAELQLRIFVRSFRGALFTQSGRRVKFRAGMNRSTRWRSQLHASWLKNAFLPVNREMRPAAPV